MKKFGLLVFLAAVGFSLQAQNGNAEKRTVSSFNKIEVSGGIDLVLSQGSESVSVSAEKPEFRDKIKTEVENGVLKIYYEWKEDKWGSKEKKNLKAYVSFRNLESLEASGGSDVNVTGSIKTSSLKLEISGGSDFMGAVETGELNIDASGGSDVNISGKATHLKLEASGGSDFSGFGLVTETCEVDANGGSDVEVTVNKEMTAEASGGSDVRYKGAGSIRNIKSSHSNIKKVS